MLSAFSIITDKGKRTTSDAVFFSQFVKEFWTNYNVMSFLKEYLC